MNAKFICRKSKVLPINGLYLTRREAERLSDEIEAARGKKEALGAAEKKDPRDKLEKRKALSSDVTNRVLM